MTDVPLMSTTWEVYECNVSQGLVFGTAHGTTDMTNLNIALDAVTAWVTYERDGKASIDIHTTGGTCWTMHSPSDDDGWNTINALDTALYEAKRVHLVEGE